MSNTVHALLVCGSNTITNKKWIWDILDNFSFRIIIVNMDIKRIKNVKTNERSVNEWAFLYAKQKKKTIISLVSSVENIEDNKINTQRVSEMINLLERDDDKGIVLWDGKSKKVFEVYQKLQKAKKLFKIYTYNLKTMDKFI